MTHTKRYLTEIEMDWNSTVKNQILLYIIPERVQDVKQKSKTSLAFTSAASCTPLCGLNTSQSPSLHPRAHFYDSATNSINKVMLRDKTCEGLCTFITSLQTQDAVHDVILHLERHSKSRSAIVCSFCITLPKAKPATKHLNSRIMLSQPGNDHHSLALHS